MRVSLAGLKFLQCSFHDGTFCDYERCLATDNMFTLQPKLNNESGIFHHFVTPTPAHVHLFYTSRAKENVSLGHARTVKAQIRLCECAVRSGSLPSTARII